jgi:hypothetical protein
VHLLVCVLVFFKGAGVHQPYFQTPLMNTTCATCCCNPIFAGEEVTISYLGGPQLLPLDARREALSSAFGFECGCPRCRAEEELAPGLATLLQDTASRVSDGVQGCAGAAVRDSV